MGGTALSPPNQKNHRRWFFWFILKGFEEQTRNERGAECRMEL